MPTIPRAAAPLALAIIAAAAPAHGADIRYTEVISSGNPLDGYGPARRIPAIDGSAVAFVGVVEASGRSVILHLPIGGSPRVVARSDSDIPDGDGIITTLNEPALDGQDVAFHAFTDHPSRAIFAEVGGQLRTVSGLGRWTMRPDIDLGRVLYSPGSSAFHDRLLLWHPDGAVETVVQNGDPSPSGAPFVEFVPVPALEGDRVAFSAVGGPHGIYTKSLSSGAIEEVATLDTEVPGRDGLFSGFLAVDLPSWELGSADIAFSAHYPGGFGVYARRAGELVLIADEDTPLPDGSGTFSGFTRNPDDVAIDGATVAFEALDAHGVPGVYARHGDDLYHVISEGSSLDGRVVTEFDWNVNGLTGDTLCFFVMFDDGVRSIYTATVPAPGALPILGAGALLLRRRRRC